MITNWKRKSWDTTVKHYYRKGLENNLPKEIKLLVSKSNKSRWKNESDDKYTGCEVANYINQELELIKRIGQNSRIKKINESYFRLVDALHKILNQIKNIKQVIYNHKELIVNTIENLKEHVSIKDSIKFFNISRATYQNYKTLVKNKCDNSYFLWCVKKYPHQLLKKEILVIKMYLDNDKYKYWSKSSLYLIAVRNKAISCSLATWYKYCKLLGYGKRHLQKKKVYTSLLTYHPNEFWCADVTIFKTADGIKHYIHFLMDHYSKKILGWRIEKSNSSFAIKTLLQEAFIKYMPYSGLKFLTDGGSENVNSTVANYLNSHQVTIKHLIAQKDIKFSNSKIEAFNKIIKHQFLLPLHLENKKQLGLNLEKSIPIYNNIRPQLSLSGNTPNETYTGINFGLKQYTTHFKEHQKNRISQNQKNTCKTC